MRRFWLFPGLALLATGCPSDDTGSNDEETGTDNGDDDDDDGSTSNNDDDGSTSVNPDSSGGDTEATTMATGESGTTMAGPICGDGTVDEGEECDDENMDNGDACSAECTIPFEIVWTMTHNGSASNQDVASGVVIDADGNVIVVGSERNTGTGSDVWVQQYAADGTEGWTFSFDGEDSLDDFGAAIAFDADGNIVVVGSTETADNNDDVLVLVIDVATQELIGTPIVIDGPEAAGPNDFDDSDSADDVAIDADGNIIVAGTLRNTGESYNLWVAQVDPEAMPSPVVWEQTTNGPESDQDFTQAVHVAADGTIYLLGAQSIAGNMFEGIVLGYEADGTPIDAATTTFEVFPNDFAFDPDGNVAIVGSHEPGNSLDDIFTGLYDDAFAEQWTASHDGPSHGADFAGGVAIDAMGRVITVGQQSNIGQSRDAWIGTYQANGDPWWGDVYTSESELDDLYVDVAVAPDGDIVVVGAESVIGEQRNSFVRKYHSL